MSEIEVKIRDDKAMLYTPYNPEFVKRIKKLKERLLKRIKEIDHVLNCEG